MKMIAYIFILAIALPVIAQPSNSIKSPHTARSPLHDSNSTCDFYTKHILGSNTPANQSLLIRLILNTAVIGNYTTPNVGISVVGANVPHIYNGMRILSSLNYCIFTY
jgi:hypothetical protein